MNNIGLIIQREYRQAVRKKSFLWMTLLTPLFFIGIITVPTLLALSDTREEATASPAAPADIRTVVIDKSGTYRQTFRSVGNILYIDAPEAAPDDFRCAENIESVLEIDSVTTAGPGRIRLYSAINREKTPTVRAALQQLQQAVVEQRIAASGIPRLEETLRQIHRPLDIETRNWTPENTRTPNPRSVIEEKDNTLPALVGTLSTLLIYLFLIIYGVQVMRSVAQEKISRIVEIIVSSIKPFDLMMGKIIGIGLVGITQFGIWIALALLLKSSLSSFGFPTEISSVAAAAIEKLGDQHLYTLAGCFILYFIGGYLLYASFFAAVGAVVDQENDSQQFLAPITFMLIFALYISLYGTASPESPLLFWCSLIPLTSPVVMLARIPYGVPMWQLALSVALLYGSFVVSTWAAARIYRTGILMYGKKTTWSELVKWVRYRS